MSHTERPIADIRLGEKLGREWVFHNLTAENARQVLAEGMSGGSFSDRPGDFGRSHWVAVRISDLGECSTHQYGPLLAYEPHWSRHPDGDGLWTEKHDPDGCPIYRTIEPARILGVDRRGRVLSTPATREAEARTGLPGLPMATHAEAVGTVQQAR